MWFHAPPDPMTLHEDFSFSGSFHGNCYGDISVKRLNSQVVTRSAWNPEAAEIGRAALPDSFNECYRAASLR